MNKNSHMIDPGILEIVGAVTQVLGLAETIQKILPTDRAKMKRRHKRIDSLIKKVVSAMDDARMALLGISESIKVGANDLEDSEYTMEISKSDFEILKRGTLQLHEAIKRMTNSAFELEAVTAGMPDEVQRYYRISTGGQSVLDTLQQVLKGNSVEVSEAVNQAEQYLDRVARSLEDRKSWMNE